MRTEGRGTVRANVLANYIGTGLTAFMAIVMSPVFLHLLGKEAFGLVALFNTMTAVTAIFELGISSAVARQLARSGAADLRRIRESTAVMELVFTGIGLLLGSLICIAGPAVARHWLNPGSLDPRTMDAAVVWLGIGFICRWNISYYTAGLNGLERQVGLNVVMVLAATVQYAGLVVVLWGWSATLPVFFAYLAACGLVQMLILRHLLWRLVGWDADCRRWPSGSVTGLRSFAGGMTLISLTTIFLSQVDKIVLSRLMPLAQFGVYSFASSTASGTSRIIGPVFNAIYPRMTNLVAAGPRGPLLEFYQLAAQVVACLMAPGVIALAFFTAPLLRVWTRNPELAAEVEPLLRWFLLGNLLGALNNVPYALQLAHGWTSLPFKANSVSIVLLVPGGIWAYHIWGAAGVAAVWFVLNAGYVTCSVPLMHRRLGWEGMLEWYARGVVLPLVVCTLVSGAAWYWASGLPDRFQVLLAGFTVLLSTAAVAVVSPAIRTMTGIWFAQVRSPPAREE